MKRVIQYLLAVSMLFAFSWPISAQAPFQGQQSFAQVGLRFNAYVDPISAQYNPSSVKIEGSPYERASFEEGSY